MYKYLGVLSAVLMSYSVQAEQKLDMLEKPNVIIFYVDDLGWQDSQLNDIDEPTPWETPNILALAKRGMNFTQGYSPAPTCAPSRGGLISGQHPAKTSFTHINGSGIPKPVNKHSQMVSPYIKDHMAEENLSLAEALKLNGYKTGHVGKWHMGKYASNSPYAHGFDFSYHGHGAHSSSKDRSKVFESKRFPLSKEKYPPFSKKNPQGISYPLDSVTENALDFVRENKDEPFFLYLAPYLVHAPIVTKNRALLEHYTDKLGIPFPQTPAPVTTPGQTNPYYGAMVTTVDWSLGRVMSLLEKTDDPRNPGKKLIDTTYIFFSSDNGGAELKGPEIITDNFPLDKGKKFTQEGGVRVPTVITGPTVVNNVSYHGLVNQLDYYPTIMTLTQSKIAKKDSDKLSGLDLSAVLKDEKSKIVDDNGEARKNLFWHFPHNLDKTMRGAIREGDFKLYKHYFDNSYSLYRLYKDGKRLDLEEAHDLAKSPEYSSVLKELSANLDQLLTDNNAIYPNLNPHHKANAAARTSVPKVASNSFNKKKRVAEITLATGKTKLREAYLLAEIVDTNISNNRGGTVITYKKLPVKIDKKKMTITGDVPKGHDAYVFMLIDENNFIVKSDKYKSL